MRPDVPPANGPVRVLRVIARLNVGGPSIQAITLSRELESHGFTTMLVKGQEGEREGNMFDLAKRLNVTPIALPTLQRAIRPIPDLRSVYALRRHIRTFRPQIMHTHTAKAGTIGRLAAIASGKHRPRLIVHTFHGHVLSGYFSKRSERIFTGIERFLAKRTDVLIAVSDEVRDDLLALNIAPPERIRVVNLGFDLQPFALKGPERTAARAAMRQELGIGVDETVVTLVARLVPIKRVDVFLDAALIVAETHPHVRFCIAGDGERADELTASDAARALGDRVVWPGFIADMPRLYAASDIVALTSDNEGTPVSLIESLAAGVPVVSTRVGGVPSVVQDGVTGLLAPPADSGAMAAAICRLLEDPTLSTRFSTAGQSDVTNRFSLDRLVADIVAVYRRP